MKAAARSTCRNGDSDIPHFVSFIHIPMSRDNLFQGINPINDRFYLPCLDEFLKKEQIFGFFGRVLTKDEFLAGGHFRP